MVRLTETGFVYNTPMPDTTERQLTGNEKVMSDLSIAVFGIGNILLSDDGVGVHTVNKLNSEYQFPGNVELIDGGTKGLDLLPLFENRDKVLIIDAANFKKEPGTIDSVEGDRIPSFLSSKLSVHQIGLPDMLFAAKLMEIMPSELCLIGIQPFSMETAAEMSDVISGKMEALICRVLDKLKEWGVEAVPVKTSF
jgi:hydrogenase maturation protease